VPSVLEVLNQRIIACELCPRLREYCAQVGREKRRAYLDWEYWAKPVPSFGDPKARVLVLGLAPGAHGSNRTGRPFTGDASGNFLYPVMHATGFASKAEAVSRNDGLKLHNAYITSVGRCAPPGNKPLPEELKNCAPFLDEEIAALNNLKVVICLGKIAFDGLLAHQLRTGSIESRRGYVFGHGVEYKLPDGRWIVASYHPSQQNTQTGKLTKAMFMKIFRRARKLAGI
jgi:uracil-DNA glycosylase family 4